MPMIQPGFWTAICDRCQRRAFGDYGHADQEVVKRNVLAMGWQELSAGLMLCPVCVATVDDPASWAAAQISAHRCRQQGHH